MIKILFLEDEPVIREVLAEYMKVKGYEVTEAATGTEAIEALHTTCFDMAVLDIIVPDKNGLEVLAYIREQPFDLPVIMLTALEDEQTQLKAFNAYADDYVVKPASPIILLKRMEAVLRRAQKKTYTMEPGLTFHEDSYQTFYDGKPLKLTLSEYLLLKTLYDEPDRVFTRELLILRIFNEDYIGNDRIIDAHVKNLRKKLPKDMIKTVIGVGYQYEREPH